MWGKCSLGRSVRTPQGTQVGSPGWVMGLFEDMGSWEGKKV